MALRAIPDLHVFRPGDAIETAASWHAIMQLEKPAALILSRQDLPVLGNDNREGIFEGVSHGGYVLAESKKIKKGKPDLILMATGSELAIALEAFDVLDNEGIKVRLVSMPCWELFDAQSEGYKTSVLPEEVVNRISIEAGVTFGWYKYVGGAGFAIGVDKFGASAPYERIYEEYGLTARAVIEAAGELLDE